MRAFSRSPSMSSSASSRRTLAGTPATSEPGGICMPSVTTAPAAIRLPAPTRAPLSTTAPIPIRASSSMVQPCSTALCPTETPAPTVTGETGVGMGDAAVLEVGALADGDGLHVSAQHAGVEHAGALAQRHLADQGGVRRRPGGLGHLGGVALEVDRGHSGFSLV